MASVMFGEKVDPSLLLLDTLGSMALACELLLLKPRPIFSLLVI